MFLSELPDKDDELFSSRGTKGCDTGLKTPFHRPKPHVKELGSSVVDVCSTTLAKLVTSLWIKVTEN